MNYQARELIMQARLLMDDIEHKDYQDWAYADEEIHSLLEDLVKIVESKIPAGREGRLIKASPAIIDAYKIALVGCQFCNSFNTRLMDTSIAGHSYLVQCKECGAEGPADWNPSVAAWKWNEAKKGGENPQSINLKDTA